MAGFGGSVKLTGESEYRAAIQKCTQSLQSMSSALKTQTTDFNNSDKSIKNTAAAQKQLNDTIQKQQQALNVAKSTLASYSTEMQKQSTLHNQLNKEYKAAVVELDKIKKASGENSTEYKKQAQVVDELGKKLTDSSLKLDENKSAMASLKSEINASNKVIEKAKQEIDGLGKETEESGEQAKKAGDGFTIFKGILANLGTQAINAAMNGLKSMGSALISVGKQSIESYAEFEQLVGGVETLFGDSSDIIMDYANNAYVTAGMSANKYMETITSFSASLLQSLGGDTEKAAEVGDMAISDMSDNANKMGTSMESIQNAYQGFAKQNYSMLDNLKLGYGGTKTEMERLLKDAEKISGIKYDISSLSDVYNAIHVVQQQMGITGTTAAEASKTISGSANAMKAAWQNMLTGMSNENANFDDLIRNLVNSIMTFLQNILPRVQTMIMGMGTLIGQLLQELVPQLVQMLPPLIEQAVPVLMTAIQNLLSSLAAVLPQVVQALSQVIPQLVQMLLTMLPQLLDVGVRGILTLIQGISDALPTLIAMLPSIITQIVQTLISLLPEILKTGIQLLQSLVQGIIDAIPELIAMIPTIVDTITEFIQNDLPEIIDMGIEVILALIDGLIEALPQLIDQMPMIITKLLTAITNNLPRIIQMGMTLIVKLGVGLIQAIPQLVANVPAIIGALLDGFIGLIGGFKDIGVNIIQGILNGLTSCGNIIWKAIKNVGNSILDGIKKFFNIHSPAKNKKLVYYSQMMAQGIGVGFEDEMKDVTKDMEAAIPTSFDTSTTLNNAAISNGYNNTYEGMVDAFKQALNGMKIVFNDDEVGELINKEVTKLIYN